MTQLATHSVSVSGVVVSRDNRVLVIRRADNGRWEAPGGVLELEETFENGVRREVAEETGVTVSVGELTGVYKNVERGIVALVFRCAPLSAPVNRTEEAAEVRWMTTDEVRANMNPAFCARVLDAFIPGTQHRAHDGIDLILV